MCAVSFARAIFEPARLGHGDDFDDLKGKRGIGRVADEKREREQTRFWSVKSRKWLQRGKRARARIRV